MAASRFLSSQGVYRDTLLGFREKELEDEFQVNAAEAARLGDAIVDAVFPIMTTLVAWQLWAEYGATGKAAHLFLVTNSIFLCRRLLAFWPDSPLKARLRTCLMVAHRLQAMVTMYRIDEHLEAPNLASPATDAAMFHRMVFLSRILSMGLSLLLQQLPFRIHLLHQLAAAAWFPYINARLCRSCSASMEEAFARVAESISGMVAASMLLVPPRRPVLPLERACSAVSAMLYLLLSSLLPSAWLLYSEAKSRLEFLHQREEQQLQGSRSRPTQSRVKVWLERQAALAVFPLAAGLLLPPLTGLLWNLLLHMHHLF